VSKSIIPFVLVMLLALGLVMYFPALSTFLPAFFNLN
jgi:TRAP-type C4-dicarboxylate transport system permease large subunit